MIIDGTGNPWFIGDVGISGDIIAVVGGLDNSSAKIPFGQIIPTASLHRSCDDGRSRMVKLFTQRGSSISVIHRAVPCSRQPFADRLAGTVAKGRAGHCSSLGDFFRDDNAE